MKYEMILIRYAEMAIKGKNRKHFEKQLDLNIKRMLQHHPGAKTTRTFGRMYITLNEEPLDEITAILKDIFGISSFSPVVKTGLTEAAIAEAALQVTKDSLNDKEGTFKVSVRRINKKFPVGSQDMNQRISKAVLQNMENLSVDVHRPDVELKVEIREEAAYISGEVIRGAGGLPVGTGGKALLLLSGGIDSPVAGYMAMKRGVTLEAIHFHSPPYTNERALEKVEDLTNILTRFGGKIKLHVVPFTEAQLAIHQQIPDNCEITVLRRFMLRIAEETAERNNLKALITGESLGQVASQTLESMYTINSVTSMPVLRPLITMDKMEVIEVAEKIGTYETSILPYEDCCTIFLPADPKTRPNEKKVSFYESFMEIEEYVNKAVEGIKTIELTGKREQDQEFENLL